PRRCVDLADQLAAVELQARVEAGIDGDVPGRKARLRASAVGQAHRVVVDDQPAPGPRFPGQGGLAGGLKADSCGGTSGRPYPSSPSVDADLFAHGRHGSNSFLGSPPVVPLSPLPFTSTPRGAASLGTG